MQEDDYKLIKVPVELTNDMKARVQRLANKLKMSFDETAVMLLCYSLSSISDEESKKLGIFAEVVRARKELKSFEKRLLDVSDGRKELINYFNSGQCGCN